MKVFWVKTISHVLILIGMLVFFYGFLLAPQREYVCELNSKIQDRIDDMEMSLGSLLHLEDESIFLDRLREDVETRKKRFIHRGGVVEAGWELISWIRDAGFKPVRLIPPIDREEREIKVGSGGNVRIVEVPIMIELEGSYLECGRFLESLNRYPFHVVPGRISMSSIKPGNRLLNIKIEFFVYVIDEVFPDGV